jgi:hypothetical protein
VPFAAVLAVVMLLLAAAPAQAATVEQSGNELAFTAAAGERNDVVIEFDRGAFVVRDHGGALEAGEGCEAVSDVSAACSRDGVLGVSIDTGDRDDSVESLLPNTLLSGIRLVRIDGGPGDDRLHGWRTSDEIRGGPGADYVSGGPGNGRDVAVMDSHDGAGGGVTVTLDATANDGLPGEGDDVRDDIEAVLGGPGDDTLIGNAQPDRLIGAGGDDRLDGGRGPDALEGGDGIDAFDGGAGADSVEAADAATEEIRCGRGWDFARGDGHDGFGADCEQYEAGGAVRSNSPTRASGTPPGLPVAVAAVVDVRGGRALVPAGCAASGACSGTLELYVKGVRLGRARFVARAGDVVLVRLPLDGRRSALAERARRGRIVVRARGEHGGERVTRRRVRLLG